MSVPRSEVERIAGLACLSLDPALLTTLTHQVGAILDYVAQLEGLSDEDHIEPFRPGPACAPLRSDEVRPAPSALIPAQMAPELADGHDLVPRVSGRGDDK